IVIEGSFAVGCRFRRNRCGGCEQDERNSAQTENDATQIHGDLLEEARMVLRRRSHGLEQSQKGLAIYFPASASALPHFGECQINAAKVVPAVRLRQLAYGLGERRTGFRRFAKKECRHAAIEQHRNGRSLLPPEAHSLVNLTAMPQKGSFLVG